MPATPLPALEVSTSSSSEDVLDAVTRWASERGMTLYPHQEEAALALIADEHVILTTPTGSGKSLVATAAIAHALSQDKVAVYTAPIKALVSEKFFDLCAIFGAADVGMLTGDAAVNADAPVLVCTAEVLANMALREGRRADVGLVVMDEFHYYAEPDRGWAWQVPLLELVDAQMLLMSATLGDTTRFVEDLQRRTGREVTVVADAPRPVPLTFSWSMTPLQETIEDLLEWDRVPVYVVHQTQANAAEHARTLATMPKLLTPSEKAALAEELAGFRFSAGFGRTLSSLLRKGVGVHHAGMLPRYRRLVERLAQRGLLKIICGTDTLGVGINVPIRTVLFTSLTKFDGHRHRVLRVREFLQVAGRAGRAGFDTEGFVVVQAPEHVIENERAVAKAGDDPKKRKKIQRKKAPDGFVVWTEDTFTKLTSNPPETLRSRMKVDNSTLLNVVAREEDAVAVLSRLTRDNHEDAKGRARLARRAIRLGRSLLDSQVLTRLDPPDEHGRSVALTVDLPADFALNQPLAHFALAALELLDPDDPSYALDVVSVVEAVLDAPRPLLLAQQWAARNVALAEMKADGVEYEERMARLDEITWPEPLADLLRPAYEEYLVAHPWLPADGLVPCSIVRHMWEDGMSFSDLVRRYELAPREGLLLRYLSDAYRTLAHTVPASFRDERVEEIIGWLGEVIRQTDSSLLDEWEALANPAADVAEAVAHHEPGDLRPSSRPISAQPQAFRPMVRGALWQRVALSARDDLDALAALEHAACALADDGRSPLMTRDDWDVALGDYWEEHGSIGTDADARGPHRIRIETDALGPAPGMPDGGAEATSDVRLWRVTQTLSDPEQHGDWVIEAEVDLDASDRVGEPVVLATALRRL
ncbi:DEAD/DEAH box helicase [Marihabitans asiaticum]|uniref:Superfamily II RNA helicase n=1 Tax=Marihabitans asiaticum TaxID=415218 RepID=A0A560WAG9_9MICO|nr:DEAD/DEAH box helicase [Marihabitans asiaticum]TWD14540.1 superfamily II RNA helicase [Marihabitans asiaticum]